MAAAHHGAGEHDSNRQTSTGNHQGLAGQLILPPANLDRQERIPCRERLGGLLRFYHRNVA